jgi:phosphotransferase system  glucose/maltose/N-acetylglucosamine-specific IIC component
MVAMQWVETTNQTYQILLAISDGVFYFMPLALSFSAAKNSALTLTLQSRLPPFSFTRLSRPCLKQVRR